MLSPFILLYQFFENEEFLILQDLTDLQNRILRLDPRWVPEADYDKFFHLRIKLSYLREIEHKLLTLFKPYSKL